MAKNAFIFKLKVLLLVVFLLNARKQVNTDFLNLISTSTSVKTTQNAIKAVLQLLNDLRSANEEAQKKAERFFSDYEQKILQDLNTFTLILNQNTATVDKNQEDLDAVADKIQQTTDYLDWNEKRRSSNNVKLELLAEQRCEANSLFIDTLREYKQALEVLEWIHSDINSKEQHVSLVQEEDMNEYADKLSSIFILQNLQVYANLFRETAVNDFVKLGSRDQPEMLEMEEKGIILFIICQVDGQETNEQTANAVVSEVVKRIQNLIEKIRTAIKNLEEQEITSANDFVDFRNNLLKEQTSLAQEYDSRQKFLNSLINDAELAQDVVNQCKEILQNTMNILKQTQDQYNQQKAQMQVEKQKRHDENQQIEEIILIYKNKVADAKMFLQKNLGDSYNQVDEQIDDTTDS